MRGGDGEVLGFAPLADAHELIGFNGILGIVRR